MKKVILFAMMLCLNLACKNNSDNPNHQDVNGATAENASAWPSKTFEKFGTLQTTLFTPPAFATVVLDKSKITSTWRETDADGESTTTVKNSDLIYSESTEFYFIDLNLVSSDNNKKAKWLTKYSGEINFEETGMYVENDHKFHHPEQIPDMYNRVQSDYKYIVSVKALREAIDPTKYDEDKYNNYLEFKVDGEIFTLVIHNTFEDDKSRFSIPMLKSLVKENKLVDSSKIAFASAKLPNANDFTYMWVVGTKAYYNYSNEPR